MAKIYISFEFMGNLNSFLVNLERIFFFGMIICTFVEILPQL